MGEKTRQRIECSQGPKARFQHSHRILEHLQLETRCRGREKERDSRKTVRYPQSIYLVDWSILFEETQGMPPLSRPEKRRERIFRAWGGVPAREGQLLDAIKGNPSQVSQAVTPSNTRVSAKFVCPKTARHCGVSNYRVDTGSGLQKGGKEAEMFVTYSK